MVNDNRKSGPAGRGTASGFDPPRRALEVEVQIDFGCYCGKTDPSNEGQRREQWAGDLSLG